jgi:hypothetical protein
VIFKIWIAVVLTWNPNISMVVDKTFRSESECWNHYDVDNGTNAKKFGKLINHTAVSRPDSKYHYKLSFDYPIRTYETKEKKLIWLSCEINYPKIFNE